MGRTISIVNYAQSCDDSDDVLGPRILFEPKRLSCGIARIVYNKRLSGLGWTSILHGYDDWGELYVTDVERPVISTC